MAWTQPCMVGGGGRREECGSGQIEVEREGERKGANGSVAVPCENNLVKTTKEKNSPLSPSVFLSVSLLLLPPSSPSTSHPVTPASYLAPSPVSLSLVSFSDVALSVCVNCYCSNTF